MLWCWGRHYRDWRAPSSVVSLLSSVLCVHAASSPAHASLLAWAAGRSLVCLRVAFALLSPSLHHAHTNQPTPNQIEWNSKYSAHRWDPPCMIPAPLACNGQRSLLSPLCRPIPVIRVLLGERGLQVTDTNKAEPTSQGRQPTQPAPAT